MQGHTLGIPRTRHGAGLAGENATDRKSTVHATDARDTLCQIDLYQQTHIHYIFICTCICVCICTLPWPCSRSGAGTEWRQRIGLAAFAEKENKATSQSCTAGRPSSTRA